MNVDQVTSNRIKDEILHGCNTDKPGWVRLSVHPTITNKEVAFVCASLKELSKNIETWSKDYEYYPIKNDYAHKTVKPIEQDLVAEWFSL